MEKNITVENNDIIYPYIVFKIYGKLYCVTSKYVSTIMQLPHYDTLPDSPPCITGVYPYRGELMQMLDLRTLFGMPSLANEYKEFSDMIDAKKQDHLDWLNELKRSIAAKEPFTLAVDPHKCAFGRWYDNYHTERPEVSLYLQKIDTPHKALHDVILKASAHTQQSEGHIRSKAVEEAEELYTPQILSLLDGAKDIFKSNIYHEMSLVLSGGCGIAIVVDEVLSVEELSDAEDTTEQGHFQGTAYISSIKKSNKISGLIMEINVPEIVRPYQKDNVSLEMAF